ncbi:MAG: Fe-S cluster protein [Candidatus Omnitrophica bacterium]|jgi:uncharacterized Fe-S cluster-containing protein|nr:Fe-S cluster protein [Candidatus Omnitrophota bacterium]
MEKDTDKIDLPGLNCGMCGFKECADFLKYVKDNEEEVKRCIHLVQPKVISGDAPSAATAVPDKIWADSLGREYDFVLEKFPEDPGPRETMLLNNAQLVKEMAIAKGDIIIGRPMGMSCGCPITHCGQVIDFDTKNGVIVWCVTGPLNPRAHGCKDIGYYSAQAYEGVITETRKELRIGMRYWFLPHRCMLQWRHSGLINFINRGRSGIQVRIEGLFIG